MSEAYKNAGVDVEAGYRSVELIKEHVKRTNIPGVLSGIGGFGGLFELGGEYKNPVLVSGTDGVGTKLKLAFIMDKHETVGQDCVAMCVNDIVCGGAKPLFFLDYIAVGKNIPENELDNIWIKFYKVDKARTRAYGGNGIGLSIVKAIMDRHEKKCGAINRPDGVEFWFELDCNSLEKGTE